MRGDDLDDAASLSAAAFDIDISDERGERLWRHRVAHPLRTDPDGAFVAELDGEIVAAAQALRRERLWCLSMLAVRRDLQGIGAGRAVLGAALAYGADTDAGLIPSSNDPRAIRLYATSGFALLPTFAGVGELDRRAIPRVGHAVAEADGGELERLEPISRDVRGAPHTSELRYALERGSRILVLGDRGFTVVHDGRVWLLAARDEEAATNCCGAGSNWPAPRPSSSAPAGSPASSNGRCGCCSLPACGSRRTGHSASAEHPVRCGRTCQARRSPETAAGDPSTQVSLQHRNLGPSVGLWGGVRAARVCPRQQQAARADPNPLEIHA